MDQFTRDLEWLTRGIRAIRIARFGDGKAGDMALELKGLKAKAVKSGAVFDRLNRAYDKLIETGDAHATDVEGLAPQISAMQDDISFAVQTLGNSVGGGAHTELPPPPLPAQPVALPLESIDLTPGALNRVKFEETAAPLTSGSAAPSEPVHE